MAVDALDTRILRLLIEQPRTSVREYARVLGVARGTLQARLDRLERDGVITGTGPTLSPQRSALPYRLHLPPGGHAGASGRGGRRPGRRARDHRGVLDDGRGDLLTRVVAREQLGHLEDVIQRLIQLPGVVRTRTDVALRERVAHRVLPLVESVGRAAGDRERPGSAPGRGCVSGSAAACCGMLGP